jgi:hypothetical protein
VLQGAVPTSKQTHFLCLKKNHFLPPLTTPASYLYSTTKHALSLQQNPETLHMQYDTLVQETSTKGPEQCPKIEQVYIFGENAEPASGPPPKLKRMLLWRHASYWSYIKHGIFSETPRPRHVSQVTVN